MNDHSDLKAIAEACRQHQPLRFMRSHGALYIRNDNGIVFDVHQNRSFPELMAQNKDYADLVLACNPESVLALISEIDGLHAQHERDSVELRKLCAARDSARRQRDQLKVENGALRSDEPNCLLCLDKKTVPSNLEEGYVMDCSDCCGEEG